MSTPGTAILRPATASWGQTRFESLGEKTLFFFDRERRIGVVRNKMQHTTERHWKQFSSEMTENVDAAFGKQPIVDQRL